MGGGFFESLKHTKRTKQDLSIIEFKNKVWNLLPKLLVLTGELILILGSKIHNFLPFFAVAPKFHLVKFSQKFKNWVWKLRLSRPSVRCAEVIWNSEFYYDFMYICTVQQIYRVHFQEQFLILTWRHFWSS